MNYFSAAGTALGKNRERRWQKLLLHARPEHHKPYAVYQESDRNRCRNLARFLFVHGCFDGAEFHHFFVLMIAEIRVDESNYAQNQEDDSENDDETLHGSEPFLVDAACARNGSTPTPALVRRGAVLFHLQNLTNGWLLLRLSYPPWLRWRPCRGALSSAHPPPPHRPIQPPSSL